jgi:HK97 family phage portal protein|nr:MAG TPA: portal protein [Caudoviricetes sp.]
MGLFESIFGKQKIAKPSQGFWTLLDGYTPTFTSWGGELYESEVIRAAVHASANHVSKLSVKVLGSAQPELQTRLRHAPNEWQTWGQFLYRLSTILDMQNTAFIVKIRDEFDHVTGIYPLMPNMCTILSTPNGPLLRYTFRNGKQADTLMSDCGILTKFQYQNDVFGEDNKALSATMDLINIQNQGIQEAVKNSASFRFMAQLKNFATAKDLKEARENFNKENLQGEGGGMLLFPNTYTNVQQLNNTPYVASNEEMERIRTNVFDYFGVNEDVLQNKAYGDAWNAFYEGRIKPFAIQFSDVVSRMLFSDNERARGTQIMATSNRLQYMSNTEKLNVSAQMADRGIMNRDEIREIWNLDPLPDGQGKAYTIRGEYYLLNDNGEAPKKGEKTPDAK